MHTIPAIGRWAFTWLPLLALLACGDLNVRSVGVTQVVPAQLAGEWRGAWTSTRDNTTGLLTIRVQEFDQQPVVSLQIDNPCLVPRDYDLLINGGSISLLADGVSVFQAELRLLPEEGFEEGGEDRRLLEGNYGCLEDGGYWSAQWFGDLPDVVDLSGRWEGTVGLPGVAEEPFAVVLAMTVRAGTLELEGFAESPDALEATIPLRGFVRFRDEDFDLLLRSAGETDLEIVMTGIGVLDPLRIDAGFLQIVNPPPGLPFSQALFQLERVSE